MYHRPPKLRTGSDYASVHELGSIDLFVVTSLKMNQLSPNFEHKLPLCMEYWLQISLRYDMHFPDFPVLL